MVSRRVQALLDQLRAQGIQDEQVLNALARRLTLSLLRRHRRKFQLR